MALEIGAILFEGVKKVVFAAISKRVVTAGESFLTKRKIESRIDDSIAQVVEQLMPFFENEHLSDNQRQVLISNCTHELTEIVDEPKELFAASLDGQKVFDRRYENGQLPQGIRDERLEDLYALVFPQIANLICAYPPAIEQWKIEGYRDNFRRLDEIAATLGGVANKLDHLASRDSQTSDVLLNRVRQSLIQRVEFQIDLTGLRGDRPDAVPLEKCFIVPELFRTIEDRRSGEKREVRVGLTTEVLNAFSGSSVRALVFGAPGAGKSTWSRWLQRQQLTSDAARVAILVRLRDLIKVPELPSPHHLIREAAGTHLREEVDANVAGRWCMAGVVTFILDGFDEVPPNRRNEVFEWAKELGTTFERVGLILTSRPLTTDHLGRLAPIWLRWELLPFDPVRITTYISNWYAYAPLLADKKREVNAEELAQKWIDDFALQPLIGTPLMLVTIIMVHHMDGELPRGRSKLYERYIDGMLGLWDSRWGVPSSIELSLDLKHRILTILAVHLHMRNAEQLGDEEIENFMDTTLSNVGCNHSTSEVLDHLRERTGLLIGPGTWSFVHKNVSEFLVAAATQDGDCVTSDGQKLDRLRLFAERHNDRWNNVLFFWAGLTAPGDLQSFIEQVLTESGVDDSILAFSLFYDQLQPHRLTEPWRTNQLIELLQRDFGAVADRKINFVLGPVPKSMRLGVESMYPSLRVPESPDFHRAFWECLKQSRVTWNQSVQSSHPSLRFIIWLFFGTRPPNVDEFRSALDRSTWPLDVHPEWLMFPATWGVTAAARRSGGLSIAKFVSVLCEKAPELCPRVPFFLLGALVQLTTENKPAPSVDTLVNVLRALDMAKDIEVDPEWLKISKEFVRHSAGSVRDSFDLLQRSLEVLGTAETMNQIDSTLVTTIREYITTLRSARDGVLHHPPSTR